MRRLDAHGRFKCIYRWTFMHQSHRDHPESTFPLFFLGYPLQPLDEEQKDVDGNGVDEDEDGDEHVRGKTDVRGGLEQIPGTECSLSPFRVQLTKTREAKLGQQGRN